MNASRITSGANKDIAAKAGTTMTGGMAIVEALIANGIDTVFGLPGAQMYPLFDALQQRSDKVRTYGARHEQTCGYMAFGYARSTGKPGVFAVVPGRACSTLRPRCARRWDATRLSYASPDRCHRSSSAGAAAICTNFLISSLPSRRS